MGRHLSKTCTKCKVEKPITEYIKRKGYKDGIFSWCKDCHREYDRTWRKNMEPTKKKETGRKNKLKQSYGITVEQYNEMLKAQNHKCAICEKDETEVHRNRLFVDHCHNTGEIRGLLCNNCNTAIGHLKDSVEITLKAATYLTRISI